LDKGTIATAAADKVSSTEHALEAFMSLETKACKLLIQGLVQQQAVDTGGSSDGKTTAPEDKSIKNEQASDVTVVKEEILAPQKPFEGLNDLQKAEKFDELQMRQSNYWASFSKVNNYSF
jgi:hypothetical protein